jgi:hypothetical protein
MVSCGADKGRARTENFPVGVGGNGRYCTYSTTCLCLDRWVFVTGYVQTSLDSGHNPFIRTKSRGRSKFAYPRRPECAGVPLGEKKNFRELPKRFFLRFFLRSIFLSARNFWLGRGAWGAGGGRQESEAGGGWGGRGGGRVGFGRAAAPLPVLTLLAG